MLLIRSDWAVASDLHAKISTPVTIMFSPIRTRIEDILNAPSQFAIPVYQRDYKWGKDEALDLIEDLRNYPAAEEQGLFLGNFIFENTKEKRTYVVDGQQRLTTILLLLVACKLRAIELKLDGLAQTIQSKITFIDSTTAESKGTRLIASDSVRDVFEHITKYNWDGKFPAVIGKKPVKRQSNRLKPIFDYFLKEIADFEKEQLSNFLRAIYNTFVIRIDIENEMDALSIFERTNARGMELEISDLLKNYLFSKKVAGIEESWDQIVGNSDGTILRMLKYFFVAKKGHVLKPQLYKKLKGYAAEVGPEQLTAELVQFSGFYKTSKAADESSTQAYFINIKEIAGHQPRLQRITAALQALREFGVTQFCPPAYAAIQCMIRNKSEISASDAKTLVRLFEAFEKYHFINNAVCERVGNEVEKPYADFCVAFADSDNFQATVENLITQLRKKLASPEEFTANFSDISYGPENLGLICYIFDRFNNGALDCSQWMKIYNPDPKLLRRNHNIEHFLPQTPDEGLKVKKETLAVIDNIGNLLAISYKTNSRLSNASPAKKMERLKGDLQKEVQNLTYVNEFIAEYGAEASSWDRDKILGRAKKMAGKAYQQVWKF